MKLIAVVALALALVAGINAQTLGESPCPGGGCGAFTCVDDTCKAATGSDGVCTADANCEGGDCNDDDKCLALVGNACTASDECTENAVCTDSECACDTDYTKNDEDMCDLDSGATAAVASLALVTFTALASRLL